MAIKKKTDGKKKTTTKKPTAKKAVKKSELSKDGKRYKMSAHHKKDKTSKQKEAKARHDRHMRATGRKKLATNYGKFAGENKKKK